VATVSNPSMTVAWDVLEPDDQRWQHLVDRSREALPFHRPAWLEVLADSYGFLPFVLAVSDAAGELSAGLPLMEVKDPLRGRRWIALPFTDRCPPLVTSSEAGERLAAALDTARREAGVERLEIRSRVVGDGFTDGVVAATHLLELAPGYEALERSFASTTRRNLRKAQREHLELRIADSEDDIVRVFYELQARTRRRLGVPVQPRRFFQTLWRLGLERGLGHALLVLQRGRPVAAAVFLVAGETVVYKYGASDERSWPLRPNNLLFAEAIRRACANGAAVFDFGRSDLEDTGLRAFKAGWGAREEPLVYASTGRQPAPRAASIASRISSAALRRVPVRMGRAIGEALYRYAA
jgi:CelD/BcsL family acetyltransferase involved in cellulose biosynthesis